MTFRTLSFLGFRLISRALAPVLFVAALTSSIQAATFTFTKDQVLSFTSIGSNLTEIIEKPQLLSSQSTSLVFVANNLQPSPDLAGFYTAQYGLSGLADIQALGYDTFALNVRGFFESTLCGCGWLVRLVGTDADGTTVYNTGLPGSIGGNMTLDLAGLDLSKLSFLGFEVLASFDFLQEQYGPSASQNVPAQVVLPGNGSYAHDTIDDLFKTVDVTTVPVPAGLPLMATGLAGLLGFGMRKRQRKTV